MFLNERTRSLVDRRLDHWFIHHENATRNLNNCQFIQSDKTTRLRDHEIAFFRILKFIVVVVHEWHKSSNVTRSQKSSRNSNFVSSKTERLKMKFLIKTKATFSRLEKVKTSFINEMNFVITKFNTIVDSLALIIGSIRRSTLIS